MRHAQLALVGLAVVCAQSGFSADWSPEGKRPVGRHEPAAETRVRSIEWVATDEGIEEPRRLPEVAASPLGIPLEMPAHGSEPKIFSDERPLAVEALPPNEHQIRQGELAGLPADEMCRRVTENPLRPKAEEPWNVAVGRPAVRSDVGSRPGEPLGSGAVHFVPMGVGSLLHTDPRPFDRGEVHARNEASPARPAVRSTRIPRLLSTAGDWATW